MQNIYGLIKGSSAFSTLVDWLADCEDQGTEIVFDDEGKVKAGNILAEFEVLAEQAYKNYEEIYLDAIRQVAVQYIDADLPAACLQWSDDDFCNYCEANVTEDYEHWTGADLCKEIQERGKHMADFTQDAIIRTHGDDKALKLFTKSLVDRFEGSKLEMFATRETCNEVLDQFINKSEQAVAALSQGMTWNVAMKQSVNVVLEEITRLREDLVLDVEK